YQLFQCTRRHRGGGSRRQSRRRGREYLGVGQVGRGTQGRSGAGQGVLYDTAVLRLQLVRQREDAGGAARAAAPGLSRSDGRYARRQGNPGPAESLPLRSEERRVGKECRAGGVEKT